MKKTIFQKQSRVIELIKKITTEIENARPSREQMIEEIKMMKFKIKPIVGDIFEVTKREEVFLESLWKIGKIEEIITGNINKLTEEEKETLFRYLENFQNQMEKKISSSFRQLPPGLNENITILELEVFKEGKKNKRSLN